MTCVFCQIAAGQQMAEIVYEDEQAVAFRDIRPQAPVHILIIPRAHISGPLHVDGDNAPLIGHLVAVAAQVAQREGIAEGRVPAGAEPGARERAVGVSPAPASAGRPSYGVAARLTGRMGARWL